MAVFQRGRWNNTLDPEMLLGRASLPEETAVEQALQADSFVPAVMVCQDRRLHMGLLLHTQVRLLAKGMALRQLFLDQRAACHPVL